jgi:hypothetical protein
MKKIRISKSPQAIGIIKDCTLAKAAVGSEPSQGLNRTLMLNETNVL